MPATTVSAAAADDGVGLRPDQSWTSTTATMSSVAISICTVSSGPLRSAAACTANPPNWAANPSSHRGLRARCTSSVNLPADSSGARSACRCSSAAAAPYNPAATSEVTIIPVMPSTLEARRLRRHEAGPPIRP